MIRSWENSFKANFNVGDCSFSVSWEAGGGGGSYKLFLDIKKEGHPQKILQIPPAPVPPPPPPHPIKNERSLNDQSPG